MAYQKGALHLTTECTTRDADGYCDCEGHTHPRWMSEKRLAYLEHSCEEWVIGGEAEIQDLITDLQEALQRMRAGRP